MVNPYTLSFGKKPTQMIAQPQQINTVIDTFDSETPSSQLYMITGVRGAGKTVLLTEIAERFKKDPDWIVADLNPERDLLMALAARLYKEPSVFEMLKKTNLNLSFFGMGVSVKTAPAITDIEVALDEMLARIAKRGKKVLITIDEAYNNKNIRGFAAAFQIFIRHNYPIFLLMTGLYENIYELQNEKSLTFLYRAPRLEMSPLNITAIKSNYAGKLGISEKKAIEMARLTKGYAFAFQVLGYLHFGKSKTTPIERILPEYDLYLADYVYEKIWSELSDTDRRIVTVIAKKTNPEIKVLREALNMTSSEMSVYRERLKKKGIVDVSQYGRISLSLPRFSEFVLSAR